MGEASVMIRSGALLVGAFVVIVVLGFTQDAKTQNAGSPAKADRQTHDYAELARVPEKARGRRNPMETDPEAVVAGKKLFEQHCAECHGSDAGGSKKAPSLLANEIQQATPGTLFWIISNGVVRRGMPVWSKLPEPQRWQVVLFLRTLKAAEESTPAASK
jgi:mono/diheme cytochrome c family protein